MRMSYSGEKAKKAKAILSTLRDQTSSMNKDGMY